MPDQHFVRMLDESFRMAGDPLPEAVAKVRGLIMKIQSTFENDPHLSRPRFLEDIEHPLLRIAEQVAQEYK